MSSADARARYLKHHNTIEDSGYVEMLLRPIEMLRQHGVDIRRVLDYGCGPAPVLVELLKQEGYEAIGYDPLFAKDAGLSRPFDAVVSVETFEHFAEPQVELKRIVGLLRPGGYAVVMTQFHHGPDTIDDWWYARDPTHVAFYSQRTLDWIAKTFDLTILGRAAQHVTLLQRQPVAGESNVCP